MRTLNGNAQDVWGVLGDVRLAGGAELRPWIRAASQVRQCLVTAEAFMQTEPGGEDRRSQDGQADQADQADQAAGSLRAAVLSMRLGRDLLHTHLDIRLSLATEGRSEWAPVVTSAPVACALLNQIGGWASQLAPIAGRAAASGRGITAADRRYLYAASQGLWAVSWAVGGAQERQPVRQDRLHLLDGIPVNARPAALPPGRGCAGHRPVRWRDQHGRADARSRTARGGSGCMVTHADQGKLAPDRRLLRHHRVQSAHRAAHPS